MASGFMTWMVLAAAAVAAIAEIPKGIRGVKNNECQDPLVSGAKLTASSEYRSHPATKATLSQTSRGWAAGRANTLQWLQVDLQKRSKVTRVATKGYNGKNQYVKKYKLQYGDDGVNFQYYKEKGQTTDKEFAGNTNWNSAVYRDLNPPITARFIRFRPTAWNWWIAMRVEVYGCQLEVSTTGETPQKTTPSTDLFATWDHNGDGFISKSEVEKKGKQWSDIKDYDLNNDQKLSREEFSILEEIVKNGVKETNYFNHFRAADYNRDGFVTAGELKKRFKELSNKDYTLGQMENYIQSKDSNGDGKFNYYEFRKALFNV